MSFEVLRFQANGKELVIAPCDELEGSLELVAGFFKALLVKEGSDLQVGHKRDITGTQFSVLVDELSTESMATIVIPGIVTPRIIGQVTKKATKRVIAEQAEDGSVKLVALVQYK